MVGRRRIYHLGMVGGSVYTTLVPWWGIPQGVHSPVYPPGYTILMYTTGLATLLTSAHARWRCSGLSLGISPGWEPPASQRVLKVWRLVGTSAQSYSALPEGYWIKIGYPSGNPRCFPYGRASLRIVVLPSSIRSLRNAEDSRLQINPECARMCRKVCILGAIPGSGENYAQRWYSRHPEGDPRMNDVCPERWIWVGK